MANKRIVVQPRDKEMLDLYLAQGKTMQEVADHFGISRARIFQRLNGAYGITGGKRGHVVTRPDLVALAMEETKEGENG